MPRDLRMAARDMSKLPVWARDRIGTLERNLAAAKAALAAGPEDSDTFADPFSDAPRPLGRGTRVRFGDPERNVPSFDVLLDENGDLNVTASGGRMSSELAVLPQVSNSVLMRVIPRKS